MACVNALCRRLKKIFSSDRAQATSRCGADAASGGPGEKAGSGGRTAEEVEATGTRTVNVNPFAASIDELQLSLARTERKGSKSKRNRLKIRKVLCFSSTESSASSVKSVSSVVSNPNGLSLTLSHQGQIDLRASSVTRYRHEFHELELVGSGEFGSVYRCLNRLDGCVYAVKRSRALARSNYAQRRATNEVHANAALNNHRHVVRYYSAWVEDDCMSIQQEYCNGGDLAAVIGRMRKEKSFLGEREIRRLLMHVAEGLRYIHGTKLAHMDIKPENIFISQERSWTPKRRDATPCSEPGNFAEEIVYKIGDLGHVSSIANTRELEDEGDCRYLPKEILREDYRDLAKADVFALGLTVHEAAGGAPLPKNGPTWHDIREGKLGWLPKYSQQLNELMRLMVHLEPERRPSAAELVRHQFLLIAGDSTETECEFFLTNN